MPGGSRARRARGGTCATGRRSLAGLGDASRDPHPTADVPLGGLVHARSGDKGGDANLGLWVSQDDAEGAGRGPSGCWGR